MYITRLILASWTPRNQERTDRRGSLNSYLDIKTSLHHSTTDRIVIGIHAHFNCLVTQENNLMRALEVSRELERARTLIFRVHMRTAKTYSLSRGRYFSSTLRPRTAPPHVELNFK